MTPQEQRLKQIESAELKARWSNYRGRSSQQLNADARQRRVAREAQMQREHRAFEKVLAENRELLKLAPTGHCKSRTPRLDALRPRLAALLASTGQKMPSRIPTRPQSRTPRLDAARLKTKVMQDRLVRAGQLARVPSFDAQGRPDGQWLWSHDGTMTPAWIPNDRARRELRLARLRAG